MRLSLFIAKRYLFSKKKQNAINIISIISVVGVAIGTTALIVIMSVFNGMDMLLQKSTDSFTPDLVISPVKGKFVNFDTTLYDLARNYPEIAYQNAIVEEKALVKYGEKLAPITVRGVTADYAGNTRLEDNIVQGSYSLKSGDNYKAVVGYGVAAELGIGLNLLTPMIFYYPNKESSTSLNTEYLYPSALFAVQQELAAKYVITDIDFARHLFRIDNKLSKIEIKLKDAGNTARMKQELQAIAGNDYKIQDKYELNRSFYAMMKSEKLAVFLVLLFILLIASFNIIGSISMLIIDKKEDHIIYKALGMPQKSIVSIFKTEGNLITFFGAAAGLILGITICFLQEKYGFITLGDGSYIIDAYPVKIVFSDILLIMVTVLGIGYIASYFPVKYLVNKLNK